MLLLDLPLRHSLDHLSMMISKHKYNSNNAVRRYLCLYFFSIKLIVLPTVGDHNDPKELKTYARIQNSALSDNILELGSLPTCLNFRTNTKQKITFK